MSKIQQKMKRFHPMWLFY